ncbi:MAG: SDR family NAD(P)-dependent oxidoreductase [Candidatus Spyradosoma sp.]
MSGRVVIVTGSRKGLGRALCEHFLNRNDFVIGCSRRDSSISHENYEHFELDIADENAVSAMTSAVFRKHGRIDLLVNNAGTALMNHALLTPGSAVEKIFATNFFGTFFLCREVAKRMLRRRFGRIVNISTVAVALNLAGESIYASSKAAVEQFTRILAAELGESGVTVNTVAPTPIATDLIKNVPKEKIEDIVSRQCVRRLGTPSDVVRVVEFFAAPENGFITGQTLRLGGVF